MRMFLQLVAVCVIATLASCSVDSLDFTPPIVCGDSKTQGEETCDDGNDVDGDGCDSNCRTTACGNGVKTQNEGCDDGNQTSGDGCDSNCMGAGCGNGRVTAAEQCDDGNKTRGDGCCSTC